MSLFQAIEYFRWKGLRGFGDLVDFEGFAWGLALSLFPVICWIERDCVYCVSCVCSVYGVYCVYCVFSCLVCVLPLEVYCFWQKIHIIFCAYVTIISGRNKYRKISKSRQMR